MSSSINSFYAKNKFFLFERGHIIRATDKRNFSRIHFSKHRQFWRRRAVFYYLHSIWLGHLYFILTFFSLLVYLFLITFFAVNNFRPAKCIGSLKFVFAIPFMRMSTLIAHT